MARMAGRGGWMTKNIPFFPGTSSLSQGGFWVIQYCPFRKDAPRRVK